MRKIFHVSVEGAQHGAKGLDGFLDFAKKAGAEGAQPSNFMLQGPDGKFLPASVIKEKFAARGLHLDGVSAHCPFWVHTTAWTGSKTIRPFLPPDMVSRSPEAIEQWAEAYLGDLMDLCVELGVKVIPMFWGTAFGWEMATGYPWGFWKGPGYDLVQEGKDRFRGKTARLRKYACERGLKLAHEIHRGTAAFCASDFLELVGACGGESFECLTVNADPSHDWEGEDWERRFTLVGPYVAGCHVKSHVIHPGLPLSSMEPDWQKRAVQFCQLGRGPIDLVGYAELMQKVGYAERYCRLHGTKTAPLVVEAEGAYGDLDEISAQGIEYVGANCCYGAAAGSFEDGMGEKK